MQKQAIGSGRPHRMRHLKQPTEHRLREFVGLGIGHDEKHQRRNKRVFSFQQEIQHRLLLL